MRKKEPELHSYDDLGGSVQTQGKAGMSGDMTSSISPFLVLSAASNIAQTLATVIIKDENMD